MRLIHTALSGYQCTIEEILESGERVAARLRFGGRPSRHVLRYTADGPGDLWSGAAFFRTTGHQIVSLWVLGDIDAVKRQLGAASTSTGP